jgi:hypothetical protein
LRLQSLAKRRKMPLSNYITLEKCKTKDSLRIIFWLIGICAIGFVLVAYSPVEMLFSYFGYQDTNGCTLYTLLGFPCPTCGMGRSLSVIILHPDFSKMFYYNPSAVFIYLLTFLIIISIFVLALFRYRIKLTSKLLKLWFIPVLLLIIVWALNILHGHHSHL